jgi:hypothetical protein
MGRVTTFPSSTTNITYTITVKSPSGNTMTKTLTTRINA